MVTPVAAPFLSAAFSLRSRSSSTFRSSSDIVTPCQLEMSHWAEEFIGGLSRVQTALENFFHASDSRCSESTGSSRHGQDSGGHVLVDRQSTHRGRKLYPASATTRAQ